jgi:hypothetical protein
VDAKFFKNTPNILAIPFMPVSPENGAVTALSIIRYLNQLKNWISQHNFQDNYRMIIIPLQARRTVELSSLHVFMYIIYIYIYVHY